MSKKVRESYDSYEQYFLEEKRLEEAELAELGKKMAPESIKEPEEEKLFLKTKTFTGERKKDFTCKLSSGEKKFARALYSKWSKRGISSGHKNNLCKIGGCKERALKTLTVRGFLENKGDYYRIISERFEEL